MKQAIAVLCLVMLLITGCQAEPQPAESSATVSVSQETAEVSEAQPADSGEESLVESEAVQEGMAHREEESASQTDARVEELLQSMTLEEKVGQMFFARFPGSSAPEYAQQYHLGGYVLFGVDFEGYTEDEVRSRIDACQQASRIPMLMGVDEEGGTVTRVSDYFRETPFLSPRDVYAQGGYALIESDTREKCELLKSLHLNVNLAPVCDLAGDPSDFMYDRSFSGDPQEAAEFARITIETMAQEQVGAALKHFPGYGNNVDTHTGIAIDEREKETFYENDFIPFEAGIAAGAGSVLVSHNIVNCFDSEYPASLSAEVHRVLREDLGFDGVIMTGDLAMGAILDYCGEVNAAVLAVEAGNDLLISTEFADQYASVLSAVQEGRITEERIDESVRRILRFKAELGLL